MQTEAGKNACPHCGKTDPDNFRIVFDSYCKVFKCKSCSFVAQYPGPGIPNLGINYKSKYNLKYLSQNRRFKHPKKKQLIHSTINHIKKYDPHAKRLLDVGCGDGQFIYYCEKQGFTCNGIEGSESRSNYANTVCQGEIKCGLFDSSSFPPGCFDVITLNQVLEHIENPRQIFQHAKKILKPGGVLCIEVPSINSPQFLLYKLTGMKKFVKPPNGFIRPHVNYFSPKTLESMFTTEGYRDVWCVTGRWSAKYLNLPPLMARLTDFVLDKSKVGGILMLGRT